MSFESKSLKDFKSAKANYFNQLSNVPMFNRGRATGNVYYDTTYGNEFNSMSLKDFSPRDYEKNLRNAYNNKLPDITIYNGYDYRQLTQKLDNKYNDTSKLKNIDYSKYFNKNYNPIKQNQNFVTESKYSYSDFSNEGYENPYKRSNIPSYIRRDNAYQSNAEKNITYLLTHGGYLLPKVEHSKGLPKYKNNIIEKYDPKSHSNIATGFSKEELENFMNKNLTESSSSYISPENQQQRKDMSPKIKHTDKIISFIKSSNGGLVSYVPTFEYELPSGSRNPDQSNWPYNNHLKIKLNNPLNQIKRNSSAMGNSFSFGSINNNNFD